MEWILKWEPQLIKFVVENNLPWVDPKDIERLRKAAGLKPLPKPAERVRAAPVSDPDASRAGSRPKRARANSNVVPDFCRHGATLTSAFTAGGFCNCDAAAEKRIVLEWVKNASLDQIAQVKDIDSLMKWIQEDDSGRHGARGSLGA